MKNQNTSKNIFRIAIVLFIFFVIYVGYTRQGGSDTEYRPQSGSLQIITDEPAEDERPQTIDAGSAETDQPQPGGDEQEQTSEADTPEPEQDRVPYEFRSQKLLNSHYEKHGIEMGFDSPEEYAAAANAVIYNPGSLHKLEQEDGDDVFYLEETGEFVVVSTDGFIRTYYYADKDYFERQ
ncbi:MAG: hypothetical protein IJ058_10770 [Lachnospiraceae bacterium]|nr:hypothetical protein [Lachnospiraceae bacterium]